MIYSRLIDRVRLAIEMCTPHLGVKYVPKDPELKMIRLEMMMERTEFVTILDFVRMDADIKFMFKERG